MQPFEQTDFGPIRCVECGRAHNPARELVGHAQHNAAAALVDQCTAIADKFLEVVVYDYVGSSVLCWRAWR